MDGTRRGLRCGRRLPVPPVDCVAQPHTVAQLEKRVAEVFALMAAEARHPHTAALMRSRADDARARAAPAERDAVLMGRLLATRPRRTWCAERSRR